jgi:long-chain acyl-CoA synthetase
MRNTDYDYDYEHRFAEHEHDKEMLYGPAGLYLYHRTQKNVIVTKNGKNIYPEEMEAYLDKSLYILESLVWGNYDETSGETYVNAQIYPNFEASEAEIRKIIATEIKALNKSIPMYKNIREFTIRDQEFEKTTTRKIKRYVDDVGEKQAGVTKSL